MRSNFTQLAFVIQGKVFRGMLVNEALYCVLVCVTSLSLCCKQTHLLVQNKVSRPAGSR